MMLLEKIVRFFLLLFAESTHNHEVENSMTMFVSILVAIISALAAIAVGIMSFLNNKNTLAETKRNNSITLAESRRIKRKEAIDKTLNEFYAPVYAYLQVTKSLHYLLSSGKPRNFRTLTHLLDPTQLYDFEDGDSPKSISLSESDNQLIREIIEIEKKIEDIIITKGGLVDEPDLMFEYNPQSTLTDVNSGIANLGLIALAISHFRVLRLAYEGILTENVEHYRNFVFPRQLPIRLFEKIQELQQESETLANSTPTTPNEE